MGARTVVSCRFQRALCELCTQRLDLREGDLHLRLSRRDLRLGGRQGADRDGAGAGAGRPGAGRDDARAARERPLEPGQTTVVAPADGTMVNVMLRPGFFVAGMPFNEVMTFVDTEYQVFAMFNQNELHQVAPGNEAEITLDTYPGRIIKAHVDSVIWAQAQGQVDASGDLPRTRSPRRRAGSR